VAHVAHLFQHDAALDYYGRRLATCSSDKTIKIFNVEGDSHQLTETLKGYDDSPDPFFQPPFSDLPAFTDLTLSSDNRLTDIPNLSHDGAIWSLSWAHPKFGTLLASCSYSGQILIWRESPAGSWTQVHASTTHTASVNMVAWAPHELG
jgi:protein transport protein SEC13